MFIDEERYLCDEVEDKKMLGVVHICLGFTDYTLCSHATDEYNTEYFDRKPMGIPLCTLCERVARETKKIRLPRKTTSVGVKNEVS